MFIICAYMTGPNFNTDIRISANRTNPNPDIHTNA